MIKTWQKLASAILAAALIFGSTAIVSSAASTFDESEIFAGALKINWSNTMLEENSVALPDTGYEFTIYLPDTAVIPADATGLRMKVGQQYADSSKYTQQGSDDHGFELQIFDWDSRTNDEGEKIDWGNRVVGTEFTDDWGTHIAEPTTGGEIWMQSASTALQGRTLYGPGGSLGDPFEPFTDPVGYHRAPDAYAGYLDLTFADMDYITWSKNNGTLTNESIDRIIFKQAANKLYGMIHYFGDIEIMKGDTAVGKLIDWESYSKDELAGILGLKVANNQIIDPVGTAAGLDEIGEVSVIANDADDDSHTVVGQHENALRVKVGNDATGNNAAITLPTLPANLKNIKFSYSMRQANPIQYIVRANDLHIPDDISNINFFVDLADGSKVYPGDGDFYANAMIMKRLNFVPITWEDVFTIREGSGTFKEANNAWLRYYKFFDADVNLDLTKMDISTNSNEITKLNLTLETEEYKNQFMYIGNIIGVNDADEEVTLIDWANESNPTSLISGLGTVEVDDAKVIAATSLTGYVADDRVSLGDITYIPPEEDEEEETTTTTTTTEPDLDDDDETDDTEGNNDKQGSDNVDTGVETPIALALAAVIVSAAALVLAKGKNRMSHMG